MKKLLISTVFNLITILSSNSYAVNCLDPQNDSEINGCLIIERENIDKQLNQVYQQLIKKDPNHKKELIKSELAWIKFRDAEAKFQSLSYQGGTLEGQEHTRWIIRITRERILHLKEAIEKTKH